MRLYTAGSSISWDDFRVSLPTDVIAQVAAFGAFISLYLVVETETLLLAVIAGFLICSVGRPVWAFGALLFSEFTAAHIIVDGAGMSVRLLLTIAALLLLLPLLIRARPWSGESRHTFFLALLFVGYAVGINFVTANADDAFKFARHALSVLAAILLVPAVAADKQQLRQMLAVVVAATALSATVAIFQHYGIAGINVPGSRSTGLAASETLLGGQIPTALLPLAGVLLTTRFKSSSTTGFLLAAAGLMLLGLYFTYTRTAMVALALGLLPFLLFLNPRLRTLLVSALFVVVVAAIIFLAQSDTRYTRSNDGSFLAREILWQAGIELIHDEPISGVGYLSFKERSLEVADRVDPGEAGDPKKVLGRYPVHNDFLGAWLGFGIAGLFFYIVLFIVAASNFLKAIARARDPFVVGLAMGSLGALVSYALNSFYHNYFMGTLALPLLVGLSWALARLATAEDRTAEEPP